MGLFGALFAGVNGINANGEVISVIGDNIANVNTVGYKASRANFEDILAGNESNIGLGSRITDVNSQFSQGGFESSTNVTDLAVDGDGFFVVEAIDGSTFYTRAGTFLIDKDGYLVNAAEQRVQGYQVDADSNLTAEIDDIVVSTAPKEPNDTDGIALQLNLDANTAEPAAFAATAPNATSNFSAGITVFDSLGNSHLVSIYFRKTNVAREWDWYALVDGAEITGGAAGTPEIEADGTLTFNADGSLLTDVTNTSDFDFINADQSKAITFDFGTSTTDSGTGLDGATQFGSDSAITNISQDGSAAGTLKSIEISEEGVITGNFTNGQNNTLAQIVLASFQNKSGLRRVGNNNFQETLDSGVPTPGTPNAGGKGTIVSSTLEQSNVDLANELIKMVIIQRGFQANSRTISTVNDMLAQLVTLGQ